MRMPTRFVAAASLVVVVCAGASPAAAEPRQAVPFPGGLLDDPLSASEVEIPLLNGSNICASSVGVIATTPAGGLLADDLTGEACFVLDEDD